MVSGVHPGLASFSKRRNFPECIGNCPPGRPDETSPQTVQISYSICAFIEHMHYPQCFFRYQYVFMLSLSYRYRVNVYIFGSKVAICMGDEFDL